MSIAPRPIQYGKRCLTYCGDDLCNCDLSPHAQRVVIGPEMTTMTAGKGEPAEVAKATLMDHSSLITTREFTNELGNRIKITIEGPNSLSENILTPLETRELSHSLNEMERALAADRTKLRALGADPGPTEDDLFSNGIMDLNSALEFAEGMMDAPGYGDMQDALGVLAKAYRKAEDRIGELLVKNDAKAAALSRAEALLAEAREGLTTVHPPTDLPPTPDGQDRFYLAIVERCHNGKAYTIPAVHLHNLPLQYEDEERKTTGWYAYTWDDSDDATAYEPLIGNGDKLLGWAEIPDLAAALLAKLEQG